VANFGLKHKIAVVKELEQKSHIKSQIGEVKELAKKCISQIFTQCDFFPGSKIALTKNF